MVEWKPRTKLGKLVVEGKITSMDQIFEEGMKIMEPEIVDYLLPGLEHELILIGGSPGKGGGIRRTPARRTARMHKSGRRYKITCMVVVGNKDGYLGVGVGSAPEFQDAIDKSLRDAKLNIIPIKRGCGSWECNCGGNHSIPYRVEGKEGSCRVILKPAPKGIGLCVSDEVKKMMNLAGIKDIWIKSFGQTQTRINIIMAVFDAFKNLNKMKV
ncbi:MAG: 30S ribosomal protein S5 [Candidatus Aenigmarchaeota archaeon]|nr:30S ribosomal protein S5 [Candidatus Aenigmarchaeota archaeon]